MKPKLVWFIHYDHLEDDDTIQIAWGCSIEEAKAWMFNSIHAQPHTPMTPFRLYDDDGELYYSGYTNFGDESEGDCFAPLDWAMAEAGCTEMQILEKGQWTTL